MKTLFGPVRNPCSAPAFAPILRRVGFLPVPEDDARYPRSRSAFQRSNSSALTRAAQRVRLTSF